MSSSKLSVTRLDNASVSDCRTRVALPDVSVIIAAFNSAAYIEKAIHSALSQSGVTVEVVVVDDASTDNTTELVSAIADERIKLIQHERNFGPGVASNTGFKHASGSWLAILDSDDVFAANRLKSLKTLAEKEHADFACDNLLLCDEDGNKQSSMFNKKALKSIKRMDLSDFIQGNIGGEGYSLGYLKPFINRQFLNKHKLAYIDDINLGEDYFIIADLLAAGAKCIIDHNANYLYTVREGSLSHRIAVEDADKILVEDLAFIDRNSFSDKLKPVLNQRRQYLQQMNAYLRAVEAIKSKSFFELFKIVVTQPKVLIKLTSSLI